MASAGATSGVRAEFWPPWPTPARPRSGLTAFQPSGRGLRQQKAHWPLSCSSRPQGSFDAVATITGGGRHGPTGTLRRHVTWVVAAWLVGIIVNLILLPGYYDIALRDVGLMVGAIVLALLARHVDRV